MTRKIMEIDEEGVPPENILSHIAFFLTLFKGYRCD